MKTRYLIVGLVVLCCGAGVGFWAETRPRQTSGRALKEVESAASVKTQSREAQASEKMLRPHAQDEGEVARETLAPSDEQANREILNDVGADMQRETRRFADEIPQRIYDALAPCYHGQGQRGDVIPIRYRLVIQNNQARIEGVSIESTPAVDSQLAGCMRSTLESLRWPETSEDATEDMDMDVSILGLQKRLRDQATPSDIDDNESNE